MSRLKCFCTPGTRDCPESGQKICDPYVSHCLLSLKLNTTLNSHTEHIQDCWHWSDNLHETVRCPKESGVCYLMWNATSFRTCCCMGDLCNNTTNSEVVHSPVISDRGIVDKPAANVSLADPRLSDLSRTYLTIPLSILLALFILIIVITWLKISRMKNLSFPRGTFRSCRCLPLKPAELGLMQQGEFDETVYPNLIDAGSVVIQRKRPSVCQDWPVDGEIEGLTSLVTKVSLKSQGCFGQVWHGRYEPCDATMADSSADQTQAKIPTDLAIKVFSSAHESSWRAELSLFRLPGMQHPNILKFYGADKHYISSGDLPPGCIGGFLEYWLVTEYHPLGSLFDYLHTSTVDWSCLLKIASGIAKGLSHLHFEAFSNNSGNDDNHPLCGNASQDCHTSKGLVPVDNYWKPVIAHRDLNSRNVLLKSNMTACIADFGLAIQFEPGHFPSLTHPQLGTRRYMAPEVLDGAIQFSRDAYLRIDVYAMGLVFWELMSRCTGGGVFSASDGTEPKSFTVNEPYRAPYELELGLNPSMEELQRTVALKKCRPKFNPSWSKHRGMLSLQETVEECWDPDAEARLSAGCVAERLTGLTQNSCNGVRSLDFSSLVKKNGGSSNADLAVSRIHRTNVGLSGNLSTPVINEKQSTSIPLPPTLSLISPHCPPPEVHCIPFGQPNEENKCEHCPLIASTSLSNSSLASQSRHTT